MADAQARLAIIINCFNYEDYVRSAIESVLSQDLRNCEIVVVDDGSTDRSWDTIKSYPVTSFRKDNGGQVSACRYGFSKTRAPFILFLDADDELLPGSIQKLIGLLDDDIAKIQFPLLRIDESGTVIGPAFPKLKRLRQGRSLARTIEKAGTYVSPPTSGNVFRRDLCALLDDAGYDTAVDGVMLIAAPFFGDVLSLDEPLGRYRLHGKNKSGASKIPAVPLIRRHQARFLDRVEHLRGVLTAKFGSCNIEDPRKMYMHLRYENYCDIFERRRVKTGNVIAAIRSFPDWYGLPRRAWVTMFLASCLVLPGSAVTQVLEARMTQRWRSLIRAVRALRMVRSG